MVDDCFEIFNADANMQLLLDGEIVAIKVVDRDGGLQGLFEYVYEPLVHLLYFINSMLIYFQH